MEEKGSSKMYVEAESRQGSSHCLEMFSVEVDNVKQDLMTLERLYDSLQESNEDIKNAEDSTMMREIRGRLNTDLDHLFKLAKQINKKYEGLIRANAAQRGSADDQVRASMISDVADALQFLMRRFQSLRTQMETDHRQIIEAKFYAITREKATAEAIDNLIASEAAGSPIHHAIQELGRDPVAEAVAEIQERRDAMREIRRNLMALHQVLLGIAAPAAAEGQGGVSRGAAADAVVEGGAVAVAGVLGGGKGGGTGGLNDYEKETRNQAYIAIVIALIIITALVISILKVDIQLENM
ncbi:syntaxin-125-like [Salvia miltiorrhiza]|uniref:syntaxin-125-like n=1 Tax=Salvia miltiorrhiza TaxID=226208 RepID=UPI0025AD1969|nr:syntaxin-125-like [Salvia miltiorrhiza]